MEQETLVADHADRGQRPATSGRAATAVRGYLRGLAGRTWFWPTTLTLVLGLARTWHPYLWRDELRSWSAATRSFGDLTHLLANTDAAVALYYYVLHIWISVFGESAVSMRLPSALAMAAAAGVLCLIAQRLFNRRVAIVAGLLFAIIPAVSRFAQEVRPYAITMLVACVATLLLLRAIERPTWRRFLLYGLSMAVLFLAQIVAAPLLLAHGLGVLLWHGRNRRVLTQMGVALGVGLGLASPLVLLSRSQYDYQVGSLPDATLHELTILPGRLFMSHLVAGAVVMLGVLAFAKGPWRERVFLTGWALLPIGAIWLVSNLGESYWMSRYMLFTLPAFAILAAVTLAALNTRFLVVVMLVIAVLGGQDQRQLRWFGSHELWAYPDYSNGEIHYHEAAAIIRDNQQPGDGLAIAFRKDYWLIDIALAYHLRGHPQPTDVFVAESSRQRGDFWPTECDPLAACLGDTERVWLVSLGLRTNNPYEEMEETEPEKAALLRSQFRIAERWEPSGLVVLLLERR